MNHFCRNGHDTRAVGRGRDGCYMCARITKHGLFTRATGNGQVLLPTTRLRRFAGEDTSKAARAAGREWMARQWVAHTGVNIVHARTLVRRLWTRSTIELFAADEWCIALGTHLSVVYPEALEVAPSRRALKDWRVA